MSVYESVMRSSLKVKRTLFDKNVELLGRSLQVVRISASEDMFTDIGNISVLSSESIPVIVRFPAEMPLDRYRLGAAEAVEETKTYFYDILPIEAFSRLSDNVERRDYLFFFLEDEKENKIPYLMQVTDLFGKFDIGLVWKKMYLAPYHGEMDPGVLEHLEAYITETDRTEFNIDNPDSIYLPETETLENYSSEQFENLFPYPLTPISRSVSLEAGEYVIQCAYGNLVIDGVIVTPGTPGRITVTETADFYFGVSSDCKYPSIYMSEFLHPFVYDTRETSYPAVNLSEGVYSFDLDLSLFAELGTSGGFVLSEPEKLLLGGMVTIPGFTDSIVSRSLLYLSDGSDSVTVSISSGYELSVVSVFGEDDPAVVPLGVLALEVNIVTVRVSAGVLIIGLGDNEVSVPGCGNLLNELCYIGYIPAEVVVATQLFF